MGKQWKQCQTLFFMAAVTICSDFAAQKNKVWHCFHCFPIYFPWSPDAMIFVFWMLSFKPTFSLSTFTFIKRLFSSSLQWKWIGSRKWAFKKFNSWSWQVIGLRSWVINNINKEQSGIYSCLQAFHLSNWMEGSISKKMSSDLACSFLNEVQHHLRS